MGRLVSNDSLKRIENLNLIIPNSIHGTFQGQRRSTHKGVSVEFYDHRDYSPGDDFRQIDWNIYARSKKPYIKRFIEEKNTDINFILDCSASMDWGTPNKFQYIKELTALLAYIGLKGYDRINIIGIGEKEKVMAGGRHNFEEIVSFLESIVPCGMADINHYIRGERKKGIFFIMSDLLIPQGIEEGLKILKTISTRTVLINILSPQEIYPNLDGELYIIDKETLSKREVTITPKVLKMYKDRLNNHIDYYNALCKKLGYIFLTLNTGITPENAIFKHLTKSGVLGG